MLRAATRLAQTRCGAVTVVLGRTPVPLRTGCEVRVHPVRVAGKALSMNDRTTVETRLAERFAAGWSLDDALVEALRTLRIPPAPLPVPLPSQVRRMQEAPRAFIAATTALIVLAGLVIAALRTRSSAAPRWERARRYLARLDDARARARALRFGAAACPICLDSLAPPVPPRAPRTVSTRTPQRALARRVRAESDSSSSSTGSTGTTRRTLPCGHAFHEQCLLRWVSGPARNCAACPVCRAPARAVSRCAATVTLVSDNIRGMSAGTHGAVVEESSAPHSVDETGGRVPRESWLQEMEQIGNGYEIVSDVTPVREVSVVMYSVGEMDLTGQ